MYLLCVVADVGVCVGQDMFVVVRLLFYFDMVYMFSNLYGSRCIVPIVLVRVYSSMAPAICCFVPQCFRISGVSRVAPPRCVWFTMYPRCVWMLCINNPPHLDVSAYRRFQESDLHRQQTAGGVARFVCGCRVIPWVYVWL